MKVGVAPELAGCGAAETAGICPIRARYSRTVGRPTPVRRPAHRLSDGADWRPSSHHHGSRSPPPFLVAVAVGGSRVDARGMTEGAPAVELTGSRFPTPGWLIASPMPFI